MTMLINTLFSQDLGENMLNILQPPLKCEFLIIGIEVLQLNKYIVLFRPINVGDLSL